MLQIADCSYHDPVFGFKSQDGIWGQVHVTDPACGACRDRNPDCMGDGGEATGDELVDGRMARDVDLVALDDAACPRPDANASDANASLARHPNCTRDSPLFMDTPRSRRARAELRLGWPMAGQEGCAFKECQATLTLTPTLTLTLTPTPTLTLTLTPTLTPTLTLTLTPTLTLTLTPTHKQECQAEQEEAVQAWAESVLRPALHRLRQKHGARVKL